MAYKKKVFGVYMIKNFITDEVYIGSSIDCLNRLCDHKKHLRKGTHHSRNLQASYDVHKELNFIFEVLESYESVEKTFLHERENAYLKEHSGKLLNVHPNAESAKGVKRSEEFIKTVSERAKRTFKGRPKSEEWKRKMSEIHKGKKISEEQRLLISQRTKEGMLESNASEKISKALTGKKMSDDAIHKRTMGFRKKYLEKYKAQREELDKLIKELENES